MAQSSARHMIINVLPYAIAAFSGALLLFLVQPILARYLLPWFGGGGSIWTTCMLFFQVLLIAGYVYAHLLVTRCSNRLQVIAHLTLILVALTFLPFEPTLTAFTDIPVLDILGILLVTVGVPGLALASTPVLIQAWFADDHTDASPYPLYAVSNGGSLVAILAYPIGIEPWLTRSEQISIWAWLYVLFTGALITCLYRRWLSEHQIRQEKISLGSASLYWFEWPACAVILMLAVTERITTDLLVMPLLWMLPLAIYLVTYVICFSADRFYPRGAMLGLAVPLTCVLLVLPEGPVDIRLLLSGFLAMLFVGCMICHGELARLRPATNELTTYYICIAVGGATGGVLVSVVAPYLFSFNADLELGILLLASLIGMRLLVADKQLNALPLGAMIAITIISSYAMVQKLVGDGDVIERSRNFYGTLEVRRLDTGTGDERMTLFNRSSPHGVQYQDSVRRHIGTGYYTRWSAAGDILASHQPLKSGRHIGLVGLGIGTLATFGRAGDQIRIYEINPDVIRIANEHFTYLQDSRADITIIEGDARNQLESEASQQFDVLVIDAFTSDSIPLHLLTVEAFHGYLRHLKPTGQIVVLTDTWHTDFSSTMHTLGRHLDLATLGVYTDPAKNENWGAEWFIFAREKRFMIRRPGAPELNTDLDLDTPLLTDDFASIWHLLRFEGIEKQWE